jgi:hypothetical protein
VIYVCPQGCVEERGMSKPPPGECPGHGPFVYTKQLKRSGPMRRVSEKRAPQVRKQGSTLKRGRGFAVAPAQREKVRDLPCIVTGQDRNEAVIHPMHLWDRGRGGCDDPLCVVPGRADIHRLYDEYKIDLLPALINGGYFPEMAHVIEAHDVSPTQLLERLTNVRWAPVETEIREAVAR